MDPATADSERVRLDRDADEEAASVDEASVEALGRTRGLSHLLDESIRLPGGYRVGLDPIVGVLPVVGDLPASLISAYVVVEAAYLGVPRATLARMVLNVAVDLVFGSVPVAGPVFDAAWKANARNVALMEARLDEPGASRRDRRLLVALAVALGLVFFALAAGVAVVLAWTVAQLGGI